MIAGLIGTVVGILAALLCCGAIAAAVRAVRRDGSVWRRVGTLALCLPVMVATVLPIDSLVGDVRARLAPSAPTVTLLAGAQHARTFVLFPTIILPASQMYAAQIPLFRQYGHVVLVDYALGQHDADALSRTVTTFLRDEQLASPYVVGTSFGVSAGIDFLRYYREQGLPAGAVSGFMAISGPADGRDVKSPVPIQLSHALNGGPLAQWLYTNLYDRGVELQDGLRPLPTAQQGYEPTVPKGAVRQAYVGMKQYDIRSLLARLQTLSRMQSPAVGEFDGIPGTVLWVGHPAGDYMIKDSAVVKLERAFPGSMVLAELPGAHANLIRWGPTYTDIIQHRLNEQFLEAPVI